MKETSIHMLAAALLFLLDAWVYGQGVLSLLVLLLCVVVLLPLWLSARGDDEELARRRGVRALAYGTAALCAVFVTALNNRAADRKAESVVAACKSFKVSRGSYPERLSDLVPAFLPSVPKAKKTLMYGEFSYTASPESHRLLWTVFPPFGRRWVQLEDGRSGILD